MELKPITNFENFSKMNSQRLILFLTAIAISHSSLSNGIVKIYCDKLVDSEIRSQIGSGVLISETGEVLTAYHNIYEATNIQIYHDGKTYDNIRVVAISPDHDLVKLKIENVTGLPFFSIAENQVSYENIEFQVTGHPNGITMQTLYGKPTDTTSITSLHFLDKDGKDIFRSDKEIQVIPIDITTYPGLSGAPLLFENKIYGIFSGGFNDGGSISWAIPINYLKELESVDLSINNHKLDWSSTGLKFDLFRKGYKSYVKFFESNPDINTSLKRYKSISNNCLELITNIELRATLMNNLSDDFRVNGFDLIKNNNGSVNVILNAIQGFPKYSEHSTALSSLTKNLAEQMEIIFSLYQTQSQTIEKEVAKLSYNEQIECQKRMKSLLTNIDRSKRLLASSTDNLEELNFFLPAMRSSLESAKASKSRTYVERTQTYFFIIAVILSETFENFVDNDKLRNPLTTAISDLGYLLDLGRIHR